MSDERPTPLNTCKEKPRAFAPLRKVLQEAYKQKRSALNVLEGPARNRRVSTQATIAVAAAIVLLLLLAGVNASPPIPVVEPETSTATVNGEQISASSMNLHQWGAVTLFHGLPSDHIRAIAQDEQGVLWFGTDGGLAQYDGRRIQKVNPDGMPAGRVTALALDKEGVLWVGTDQGAGRLAGGKFQPISETRGQPITSISSLGSDRFVVTSARGAIYLSSSAGGSVAVKSITEKESRLLLMASDHGAPLPLTASALAGGTLLVGSRGRGLLEVENDQPKELNIRPRSYFINGIVADSSGRVWIGTETGTNDPGLYEGDSIQKIQRVPLATGSVSSMAIGPEGDLWVGTEKHGAFHISDGRELEHFTFENTAGGLRSDLVYSTYVDREGVVWFGTDRGVCRFDPGSPHAERISNNPESNFIRCLYQSSDGMLWCGTNRGLFFRKDPAETWGIVDEVVDKAVYSIVQDPSGHLLVGTSNGLYSGLKLDTRWMFARIENGANVPPDNQVADSARIDNANPRSTPASNTNTLSARVDDANPQSTRAAETKADNIRAVCTFNGTVMLASYGRGLEQVKDSGFVLLWPTDPKARTGHDVVSLYAEGNSRLWIGTAQSGVFYMEGSDVRQDPALGGLAGSAVWSISGDRKSGMWFATAHGLFLYRNNRLNAVLDGVDARCVAPGAEPGQTWCATAGGGLYELRAGDSDTPKYSRIDSERGLPSDSTFALLASSTGSSEQSVWVGTNRGLARYRTSSVPPRLRIVRILGKRLYQPEELRQALRLDYPQNGLLLEVEGLSTRTFPEQFQYSFALIDHTGKAIKEHVSREPQFVADSLPPGQYRIRAIAYSNDLVPSAPLVFTFSVASAPFPRTTAALSVLLLLALVALTWGYVQNRRLITTNAKIEDTNRQLAQTRLQLANETENERRRIARDLHDQTLTDLRRLMLMTDEISSAGAGGNSLELRNEIEAVSTEIRHICEDLSPSVLANVGLTAALEWALTDAVAHMPANQKFEYEFVCPDDTEDRLTLDGSTRIHVYRIVQEAISNVCQHAGAKKVVLRAEVDAEGALVIILEDDGRGFDSSDRGHRRGRGLNNIESRASLIDAEASWAARPGSGTRFRLRKPNAVEGAPTSGGG